jgi:uncharacterized protein YjlB
MTTGNLSWVSAEHFEDDGIFPNSRLPALIYRAALSPEETTAAAMAELLGSNGWQPAWRSGIYPFHHYHSKTHEVLGIASGFATLMLGGPKGRSFDISQGDVVLLPAGVVHKKLSSTSDFLVVGGYPPGHRYDLLRGHPGERPLADLNIDAVPMPHSDPVGGMQGPVFEEWQPGVLPIPRGKAPDLRPHA